MSLVLLFGTQAPDRPMASLNAAPELSLGVAQFEGYNAISSTRPQAWNYMSLAVRWARSGGAAAEVSSGSLVAHSDHSLSSLPSRGFLNPVISWEDDDAAEQSSGVCALTSDHPLTANGGQAETSSGTGSFELVLNEPASEKASLARSGGGAVFALFSVARGESGIAFEIDCRPWLAGMATMVEFVLQPRGNSAPFIFEQEIVFGDGGRTAKFVVADCPADATPGAYAVDVSLIDDQGRTGRQWFQLRVN